MVEYRTFRNDDPPRLAALWNEVFTGRGAVRLRTASPLERHLFAKPYFDSAGFFLALENGVPVGFAHAGFGPNETEAALSHAVGVLCIAGVRPSHRRRGIGTALVRRCEEYLRGKGASTLYAGPMRPFNPFYLGLYGGSELPGLLASDPLASPFLARLGYERVDTCLVFQRALHETINVPDARFSDLRRRCEVCAESWPGPASWWEECVRGPLEFVGFHVAQKEPKQILARASVWEMDGFTWRWNQPAAAIADVLVQEDQRRQGLGKFLLTQILRYLQDQYFGIAEVQTMQGNAAAIGLYRSLGFTQVDEGYVYRKQ